MKIKFLMITILLNIVILLILTSCSSGDDIEAAGYIKDKGVKEALIRKKQDYYKANKPKLKKKIDYCRSALEKERESVDCLAARRLVNYI